MIVLKSTHEALLQSKDSQIRQLQEEISFLRSMVQPRYANGFKVSTEASAVLEARQDPIEIEEDEITAEAERILAGTY